MRKMDLVIIGGGPAGLAAAISAYESGIRDLVILERENSLGGILKQCIHNGFGLHTFHEELTGPEYARRFIEKVHEYKIPYELNCTVIELTPDKIITCVSPENGLEQIKAKAIILAMGCREKPRGAINTPGTRCAGIFSAGTAQKLVNLEGKIPGKRIVILGSGDIGLIMARRMTFIGAKVLCCVELMPYSSGLKRNIVQCLNDYDIPLLLSHTVTQIHGKNRVEAVTIAEIDKNMRPIPGTEQRIECDTLLLSVGLIPENELSLQAGVEMEASTNGPQVDDSLSTSIDGIFACGNVLHVHDLVDFVTQESSEAGKNAAAYLKRTSSDPVKVIPIRSGFGVNALVPQRINVQRKEGVRLMFRPRGVYKGASVIVRRGEEILLSQKKKILTPGEMVSLNLSPSLLDKLSSASELDVLVEPQSKKEDA